MLQVCYVLLTLLTAASLTSSEETTPLIEPVTDTIVEKLPPEIEGKFNVDLLSPAGKDLRNIPLYDKPPETDELAQKDDLKPESTFFFWTIKPYWSWYRPPYWGWYRPYYRSYYRTYYWY